MNTKLISEKALGVIDQYLNFHLPISQKNAQTGAIATCSIPYFNNRRAGVRGGLRALTGKGSPRDIYDEIEITTLKEKIDLKTIMNSLSDEAAGATMKKFLIDNNIGIDCSGLVYYIVNAESLARDKGTIDRHLSFPYSKNFIARIKCKLRPVGNTDVMTLAHNKNSRVIPLADIEPGDMITMTKRPDAPADERARDHVVLIHQIEYQNFVPMTIHYTNSIAWPSDGAAGHGVRQGVIEIIDPAKPITEQRWIEMGKTSNESAGSAEENYTFFRAQKSITEIRRPRWF